MCACSARVVICYCDQYNPPASLVLDLDRVMHFSLLTDVGSATGERACGLAAAACANALADLV